MQVYKYDEEGYYTGSQESRIDPKDGGHAKPPHSTEVKPSLVEGEVSKWNGSSWDQVTDNRGEYFWDKSTGIRTLCETVVIPENITDIESPNSYSGFTDGSWIVDEDRKLAYDIAVAEQDLAETDVDIPRGAEDIMDALDDNNVLKKSKTSVEFQEKLVLKKERRAILEALKAQRK